jgi:hypothetical protein
MPVVVRRFVRLHLGISREQLLVHGESTRRLPLSSPTRKSAQKDPASATMPMTAATGRWSTQPGLSIWEFTARALSV